MAEHDYYVGMYGGLRAHYEVLLGIRVLVRRFRSHIGALKKCGIAGERLLLPIGGCCAEPIK